MTRARLILLIAIAAAIVVFFTLDLGQYFSLGYFKSKQAEIIAFYHTHPWQTALAFFAVYVAVTGLSLPGATIMTLVAGAIFGLLWGTLIVSFASSIGATLAFLASRFLFRDAVQSKLGDRLRAINAGVQREGAFYLFTLRLVPAFPFFVINLVMGLTPIKTRTFYWVSQVGMLLGTIVYVNAGTQLAQIESLKGILSPTLLISFALLGIFPLIAKKIVDWIKARKVYAKWTRPARFDRNLVVIGAGSAGLVAAYIAAAVKAKVTLVEKHKMGGECLNTGCVPSKALIRSAKLLSHIRHASNYGIRAAQAEFDFAEVMERVHKVIRAIEPHDSVERYTGLGVEVIEGEAKITSPWTVEVRTGAQSRTLTTRSIVIAAGAAAFRAADPRHRGSRVRDFGDALELACPAQAAGGAGRRPDRLRAGPGFRPLRRAGHAGGDAAPHPGPRGSGDLRDGGAALPRGRRERAGRSQGQAVRDRQRRESADRRACRRRCPDRVRRAAGGGRARRQHQRLRTGGAGHRHHQAAHGGDQRVSRDHLPEHLRRAATWPGRSSSPTPPRTRPGTRR